MHAATRILTSGPRRVGTTAQRLSISERQLRNLFAGAVGLSPKRFARIDRVRTVLAHARHSRPVDVATETGYDDQSHMTAEFRATMGVPLGAFIAGERPPAVACAGTP